MKKLKILFPFLGLFLFITNIHSIDLLSNINTDSHEFSPSISPDGNYMLFNSKRGQDQYQDIYISYFKNGIWSKPEKFNILNSPFDDETPFISPDGTIIIFASNRDGSMERQTGNNIKIVSFDLYWSHLENGKWTSPEAVPGNINTPDHERAPAINHKNDRLFFSRWAMGKIENAGIYFSILKNSRFDEVYPLPSEINSGNKEVALIPDPDGKGYYFSSTRPGGNGGWDIYFISFHNGQFGMPVNLGDEINSPGNEAFFSIFNGKIYFCSNFKDKNNDYDIIGRHLPGERYLNFRVVDQEDTPLIAIAEIQKNNKDKSSKNSVSKSDSTGKFSTIIDDKTNDLNLFIEKPGYLPYFKKISEYEMLSPEFKIILEPIKSNDTFSIDAIYFDYNNYEIKPESFVFLDRLAEYLKNNPQIKLKIIGHTDLHGNDDFNQTLSEQRAKSVEIYLTNKGILQKRLQSEGKGKNHPVIKELNEHADRLNRRTEFKVLK
jgi:outer membrane protein OmpA-like peptidoglycan-associated protein